ncbi:MAG: BrnA antitoxin family protein [Microcoleaceae cyanobacterium MO_207.B10]|nr:BrnA antitoxin family protein [Microcoleaceae cyanobacterium MO_207.B10]
MILRIPSSQVQNLIELDVDVMAWFRLQTEEYKTMINEILRRYIESNS